MACTRSSITVIIIRKYNFRSFELNGSNIRNIQSEQKIFPPQKLNDERNVNNLIIVIINYSRQKN